MATMECIYLESDHLKIHMRCRPDGDVWIKVPLPVSFADCIWKLAQAAADKREQEIRAEILGDNHEAS